MLKFQEIYTLVENAIRQLGMDPAEARTEHNGQWNLAKNESIQIMIDIWEEQDRIFFQTMSPVCEINDATDTAFLKMLLEENHGFCETAFTILDNSVFLKFTAEAVDMNEDRVVKSITRVAYYNELFREKLN